MNSISCTAFDGHRRVASGLLREVALQCKQRLERHREASILIFNDETSELVEVDFRGTPDDVARRIDLPPGVESTEVESSAPRGPGRPRLGVVAREVTLLPRHWEWLSRQPGGASVALRKLAEEARRIGATQDAIRRAREVAYKFMVALGGDLPAFEEATRALFAGKSDRLAECLAPWPADVREHALKLARPSFELPANA